MTVSLLNLKERNAELVAALKQMLKDAESGEIVGIVGIKLRPDNRFAVYRIGDCSDLEMAGALAFALNDLIAGNKGEQE